MKLLRGTIFTIIAALTTVLTSSAQIATYNLSADYSTNQNPSGVWSHGYFTNITSRFVAFSNLQRVDYGNGAAEMRWNRGNDTFPWVVRFYFNTGTSDGGQGVYPPGTVLVFGGSPGSSADYGVVRFTAPSNGNYTVNVGVTNYLNGPSSGDTDFHVRVNGAAYLSNALPTTIATNYSFTTNLLAGGTIDFATGRGADNSLFGSGLKIGSVITLNSLGGPSYQLSKQYPISVNPSNGWTLGYKSATNASLVSYTNSFSSGDSGGNWAYWQNNALGSLPFARQNTGPGTINNGAVVPVGGVNLHPGPSGSAGNYSVARFTIPYDGNYRVTAWAVPAFPSGQGNTDFHVLINGSLVKGAFLSGSATFGYTNDLFLAAGTSVEIASGRGTNNNSAFAAYLNSDLLIESSSGPVTGSPATLSDQFPIGTNPANAWVLGYKSTTNGAFVPYTAAFTNSAGSASFANWGRVANSESWIRKNLGPSPVTIGGQGTFPVGGVSANPGPSGNPDNYAVARYTIPSNGTYRVTFWATATGSGNNYVQLGTGSVDYLGQFVLSGASVGFTNNIPYTAGTVIDVAIGRGPENSSSGTIVQFDLSVAPVIAAIPPPDIAFTPTSGSFTNQVTVGIINNVGAGSQIRYTINDVDPTIGSQLYSTSFTITSNATIRARLFANGNPISDVFTNAYTKASDVQFNPLPGTFTNVTTVSLVNLVGSGQIRYTINGSDPTASSTLYSTPLTITSNATFRAGLFLNGFPISTVSTGAFTQVLADGVRFGPAPGLFTNSLTVRLTNTFGSGEMRFTINGAAPTAASPLYAGAFTITSNATIRAALFLNGATISAVSVGDYGRVYALADGIPNAWRQQYFGAGYLTDPRVGAGTDADGDGSSNLQEYFAGTDPLNPLSGFTVGIQAIPRITFVSIPGTTYKILRRDNANALTSVEVGQVTAVGTQTTFLDTSVTNPTGFYTVQAVP